MARLRAGPRVSAGRFFLPPDCITGGRVTFSKDISHQIRRVLRLRPGDRVVVLDGTGDEHLVRLDVVDAACAGTVESTVPNAAEPRLHLILYLGLLKGSKLELVVQKCTEIGVSAVVPVVTARSIPGDINAARLRRLTTIAREAAEQSGRGRVPAIAEPVEYQEALRRASDGGLTIFLWEGEREKGLPHSLAEGVRAASLFVGPEGGFTADEAAQARAAGAAIVSIGRRILRAETAATVGAALVLDRAGDLSG